VLAAIDPNSVSPGVAGFLVVFVLGVATWLLIRSMVGHLRKVRYSPDPAAETSDDAGPGEAGDVGTVASTRTSGAAGTDKGGAARAGRPGPARKGGRPGKRKGGRI
jgi:hypothetical protein